jgi:hypothetical protein
MARKSSVNVDSILVERLAVGASQTEAARAAGVGRKAVYLRLQDPAFRQRVDDFRDAMLDQAAGKLASGLCDAIDHLKFLMKKAAPDSAQVSAAKAIGDMLIRVRELDAVNLLLELEAKVKELDSRSVKGPYGRLPG